MNTKRRNFYCYIRLTFLNMLVVLASTGWSQGNQDTPADGSKPVGEATNQVPDDAGSIAQGQALFSQHCTVCHAVGKQIIGPALASVQNRRPIDWLVGFIQNSQHVIIDQEDEYAQYLYQQYEKQVMPNFEFLSRDEILDILAYIQVESSSTTAGVNSITKNQAQMAQDNPTEESVANAATGSAPGDGTSPLTMILVGIILVLMVIIIVLAVRNRTKTSA